MVQFEANIFPVFEGLKPEELSNFKSLAPQMERFFAETPLTQNPVATITKAEVDTGLEHSREIVENYQFVITRRYMFGGELHVGGANGEVLNIYLLIQGLKQIAEKHEAMKEYYERGGQ